MLSPNYCIFFYLFPGGPRPMAMRPPHHQPMVGPPMPGPQGPPMLMGPPMQRAPGPPLGSIGPMRPGPPVSGFFEKARCCKLGWNCISYCVIFVCCLSSGLQLDGFNWHCKSAGTGTGFRCSWKNGRGGWFSFSHW